MLSLNFYNKLLIILFLSILLIILNHREINQDLYGIISREKTNILDYILLILFLSFYVVIYKQNIIVVKNIII